MKYYFQGFSVLYLDLYIDSINTYFYETSTMLHWQSISGSYRQRQGQTHIDDPNRLTKRYGKIPGNIRDEVQVL